MNRYTVKILIYGIEPLISRTFSISGNVTFQTFHTVIQEAMGWEDKHDHEFRHGKGKQLNDVIADAGHEHAGQDYFKNEAEVTLDTFVGRKKIPLRFLYRYDFFEDWVHEITIVKKEETDQSSPPEMICGERACPPEDSGGTHEYMACLSGESDWLDIDYDPEAFDLSKIKFPK